MTGAAPMSDKDDEKKPGVYEVDTMPPPPGESDPYSAATRVGAMPLDVLAAMKEATLSGNPLKPQDLPKFSSAPPSSASAEAVAALRKIDGIPVLHEEDVSTRGNTELYVAPVAQQQPPSTPARPREHAARLAAGAGAPVSRAVDTRSKPLDPRRHRGRVPHRCRSRGALPLSVEVFWARTSDLDDPDVRDACAALLAPEERLRHDKLRFEANRRELLATRALCRLLLGRKLGRDPRELRFTANAFGRPALADAPSFNLTNTLALVACAIDDEGVVGLDAEPFSRAKVVMEVAATVFTDRERAQLEPRRALELWTSKEAYMKARGLGMSLEPRTFEIYFRGRVEVVGAPEWSFALHEIEEHLVAVCSSRGAEGPIARFDLSAAFHEGSHYSPKR